MQPQDVSDEPQSFRLYTGKAPWPVQIVGGVMWLGGLGLIVQGIPLLLIFGVGLIPICLGTLTIHYARAVFKMQRSGYRGSVVLLYVTLGSYFIAFLTEKVTLANVALLTGAVCYTFINFVILRKYRSSFS